MIPLLLVMAMILVTQALAMTASLLAAVTIPSKVVRVTTLFLVVTTLIRQALAMIASTLVLVTIR
jgi:hypothetical protein